MHMSHRPLAIALGLAGLLHGGEPPPLAARLIALHSSVLDKTEAATAAGMLPQALLARRREAAARELTAFAAVSTRADWEAYRAARLAALQASIGNCTIAGPALPAAVAARPGADAATGVELVGTVEGDGFRIENLIIAGRPGLPITGNLYAPAKPGPAMPGILIIGSHHSAKIQGELQDMGVAVEARVTGYAINRTSLLRAVWRIAGQMTAQAAAEMGMSMEQFCAEARPMYEQVLRERRTSR